MEVELWEAVNREEEGGGGGGTKKGGVREGRERYEREKGRGGAR